LAPFDQAPTLIIVLVVVALTVEDNITKAANIHKQQFPIGDVNAARAFFT